MAAECASVFGLAILDAPLPRHVERANSGLYRTADSFTGILLILGMPE